jgi:hypothetical protein
MNTLTHLQAHLQFAQADTQTKNCKRACKFTTEEKIFFKIPPLLKFFKTATTQPTQRTAKATTDKDYSNSTDRTPAGNRRLAKVAVQCSADSFLVNQSLVLRINICGKNRHLRQAPKRYEL